MAYYPLDMVRSLHSPRYGLFRRMLVEARENSGLTQSEIAEKLGKPQSFISKYERGERRLDVTEWVEILEVIQIEPSEFIREYEQRRAQTATLFGQ